MLALALVAMSLLAGCKPDSSEREPREEHLVVFGAASLRDVFSAMADEFKKTRPSVEVRFNFAGSQELRIQIEHGASADVFASADARDMEALHRAGTITAPSIFARNEPVLVVPKGKSAGIRSLADLPSATRIVLGAPEVPIGRYSLQILDNASQRLGADFRTRVESHVVSRELNVRQVLAKVSLGEADAGIVYRTDTGSALDRVDVITIPSDINVIAEYPLGVFAAARHAELGRAWVEFVHSATGQEILKRNGFLPPAATDEEKRP